MSESVFNQYIQIFIALVTLFAALVALFQEKFWNWWNRPQIKVFFDDNSFNCYHKTVQRILFSNGTTRQMFTLPTYYIRLKVLNEGKSTSKNVEVVLEKSNPLTERFIPLNLSWSSQVPDATGISRTVSIPPGQSREVDIIEVTEPIQTIEASKILDNERFTEYSKGFRCCSIKPTSLSDIFPKGKYTFYIGIYGENVKPKYIDLSINYDGKWDEDTKVMKRQHLKVKFSKEY